MRGRPERDEILAAAAAQDREALKAEIQPVLDAILTALSPLEDRKAISVLTAMTAMRLADVAKRDPAKAYNLRDTFVMLINTLTFDTPSPPPEEQN